MKQKRPLKKRFGAKALRGQSAHFGGMAAEDIVAQRYERSGFCLREKRWRGPVGEIDLIFEKADALIFVEVKKAKDFAQAAARISGDQIDRILASASGYLACMPFGQLTETRFDAALVNAEGRVEIVENAFL